MIKIARRAVSASGVAVCALVLLSGCGSSTKSEAASGSGGSSPGVNKSTHTISVGAVEPLTGPNAAYGENAYGTEAYFDYVNAHGGVNGWKLKFITRDDQYEPALAASGARQLVQSDHVFALAGVGGTPPGQAILPYAIQTGIPDIGMSMDTGYLQVKYPTESNLFGFQPSTASLSAFAVQYAIQKLHAKTVGLFYGDDATGTPAPPAAQYIAQQDHAKVVPVAIPDSASDYSGYVSRMAAAKPQVVVTWTAPPQTIGIIKAAHSAGFSPTWFGPFYNPLPAVFSALGSLANNMYFESWFEPFGAKAKGMQTFIKSTEQYTTDKHPTFLAELGWIGAAEFVHGLSVATAGGKTPTQATVDQALDSGKPFSAGNVGVTLKFKSGTRLSTVAADKVLRYSDGKLSTIDQAPDPVLPSSVLKHAYGG